MATDACIIEEDYKSNYHVSLSILYRSKFMYLNSLFFPQLQNRSQCVKDCSDGSIPCLWYCLYPTSSIISIIGLVMWFTSFIYLYACI